MYLVKVTTEFFGRFFTFFKKDPHKPSSKHFIIREAKKESEITPLASNYISILNAKKGSIFKDLDLTDYFFERHIFQDVIFERCDFSRAVFTKCPFRNVIFRNCKFQSTEFMYSPRFDVRFEGFCLFEDVHFVHLHYPGADFHSHHFDGARFVDCNLKNANFSDTSLFGVRFLRTNLDRSNFTSVYMKGVRFFKVSLCDATILSLQHASDILFASCRKITEALIDDALMDSIVFECDLHERYIMKNKFEYLELFPK